MKEKLLDMLGCPTCGGDILLAYASKYDDREIIEGIRVYTGGRHTFASQYVGVHTDNGTVVIASDNMYLYENLEKHAPIAQTFDADSNIKAQDRMRQIASRPDLIIPGHDPEVFVKFPKPGNGVARIQ